MATVLIRVSRIEIVTAALFIIAYLIVLPAVLTTFCSAPRFYRPTAYNFSISGQAQENPTPSGSKTAIKGAMVGEIKATGSAEQQQQTIDKPESWGHRFWCDVNASDWFIGLFTLLLAIATYFLWRETERLAAGADDQVKKMVDGINATVAVADKTKEVADAMQDAASAMRQVAGVSEAAMLETQKSSQRELRAYLSVEPSGINQLIAQQMVIGQVIVRNMGKVPARNVVVTVNMRLSGDRDTEFAVPADRDDILRSIQPGAAMRQGSENYLPTPDVTNPGKNVFVFGVVYYEDGFNKRRFTRFCHRYATESFERTYLRVDNVARTVINMDKARYHTHGNESN